MSSSSSESRCWYRSERAVNKTWHISSVQGVLITHTSSIPTCLFTKNFECSYTMQGIFLNTETYPASFAHPAQLAVKNTSFLLNLSYIISYIIFYKQLILSRCLILQTLHGRRISSLQQTITWKEIQKQFIVPNSNKQPYDCTKSLLHTYIQAFFKK